MDQIVHITYIILVWPSSAKVCSTFCRFCHSIPIEKGSALHLITKALIPGRLCSLSSLCLSLSLHVVQINKQANKIVLISEKAERSLCPQPPTNFKQTVMSSLFLEKPYFCRVISLFTDKWLFEPWIKVKGSFKNASSLYTFPIGS